MLRKTKRIQLPSGKVMDVEYFYGPDDAESEETPDARNAPLHICASCGRDNVYPLDGTIEEIEKKTWRMTNHCPDCDMTHAVVATQAECDMFDDHLENAKDALEHCHKRWVATNMADEIDRFVQALEADAILPEDF